MCKILHHDALRSATVVYHYHKLISRNRHFFLANLPENKRIYRMTCNLHAKSWHLAIENLAQSSSLLPQASASHKTAIMHFCLGTIVQGLLYEAQLHQYHIPLFKSNPAIGVAVNHLAQEEWHQSKAHHFTRQKIDGRHVWGGLVQTSTFHRLVMLKLITNVSPRRIVLILPWYMWPRT